jgi:hypothetical protein
MYSAFQYQPYSEDKNQYLSTLQVMPRATNVLTGDALNPVATHFKGTQQFQTRPYRGFFSGPGMASLNISDVNTESALRQGTTESAPYTCTNINEADNYRFNCLPEYGNPQQIIHIIPPKPSAGGWIRGGENTRDYVRRQRCACK